MKHHYDTPPARPRPLPSSRPPPKIDPCLDDLSMLGGLFVEFLETGVLRGESSDTRDPPANAATVAPPV